MQQPPLTPLSPDARPRTYLAAVGVSLRQILLLQDARGADIVLLPGRAGPWRRARRILDMALVAAGLGVLAIVATGGFSISPGGIPISATRPDKMLRIALLLGLLRLAVDDATGKRVLLRMLRGLACSGRLLRVAALVLAIGVVHAWGGIASALRDLNDQAHQGRAGPTLRVDSDHQHLPHLVGWVVQREARGPVAVAIEDVNPRGHLASYYCYPRVLLMSVEQHRRSAELRMSVARKPDPGWSARGARPSTGTVAAWAAGLGLDFVVARPTGAEAGTAESGEGPGP